MLMTVAFDKILKGSGDLQRGAWALGIALDRQADITFKDGLVQGGNDFVAFDTIAKSPPPPMGLFRRLVGK